MRNTVSYEWAFEFTDDEGEIIDTSFEDKLSDLSNTIFGKRGNLVLVRNEGNENAGLQDRNWAYVSAGKLPLCFSDGVNDLPGLKVPDKYHKELAKYFNI